MSTLFVCLFGGVVFFVFFQDHKGQK